MGEIMTKDEFNDFVYLNRRLILRMFFTPRSANNLYTIYKDYLGFQGWSYKNLGGPKFHNVPMFIISGAKSVKPRILIYAY